MVALSWRACRSSPGLPLSILHCPPGLFSAPDFSLSVALWDVNTRGLYSARSTAQRGFCAGVSVLMQGGW